MLNLSASCSVDVSRATVTIGGDRRELEYISALWTLDPSTATIRAVGTGTMDQRRLGEWSGWVLSERDLPIVEARVVVVTDTSLRREGGA